MKPITIQTLFIVSFFVFFFLQSCHSLLDDKIDEALRLAGDNRHEIEKVLDYYKKNPEDSLKLRAAKFLIENMVYHHSQLSPKIYDEIFENSEKEKELLGNEKRILKQDFINIFNNNLMKFQEKYGLQKFETHFDILNISSEYLIENIELAFKADSLMPVKLHHSFEEFCEYVLPYRASNEPLTSGLRAKLFEEYQWVYDSLKIKPFISVINDIQNSIKIYNGWPGIKTYNGPISFEQLERSQVGKCVDITNFWVNTLRAIGIPAGNDHCITWGNTAHGIGHDWLFVLKNGDFIAIESENNDTNLLKDTLKKIYKHSSLPKIYRRQFSYSKDRFLPLSRDVTNQYRNTFDITIANEFNVSADQFGLFVYSGPQQWKAMDKSFTKNGHRLTFKDLGENVICIIGSLENNSFGYPVNYPFYLTSSGHVHLLKPNKNDKIENAVLERKFTPFYMKRNKLKLHWYNSLNHCQFQGSNNSDFSSSENLLTISGIDDPLIKTITFNNDHPFSYYRLVGENDRKVHIAEFNILDTDLSVIKSKMKLNINESRNVPDTIKLTDSLPLTYIKGKKIEIIHELKQPKVAKAIRIQPRNDDNNISLGDEYELFFWDGQWKSLGKKIADDYTLLYKNIPSNSLFLLRNLTKGIGEYPFLITSEGKQFWVGCSEYIGEIYK